MLKCLFCTLHCDELTGEGNLRHSRQSASEPFGMKSTRDREPSVINWMIISFRFFILLSSCSHCTFAWCVSIFWEKRNMALYWPSTVNCTKPSALHPPLHTSAPMQKWPNTALCRTVSVDVQPEVLKKVQLHLFSQGAQSGLGDVARAPLCPSDPWRL